jgi:hypothetical protein
MAIGAIGRGAVVGVSGTGMVAKNLAHRTHITDEQAFVEDMIRLALEGDTGHAPDSKCPVHGLDSAPLAE